MKYDEIGIVARDAAVAASLPVKVSFVYLNCSKWEISFSHVGTEGRQFSAVVNLHSSDNRNVVQSEIQRQLLEQYAGKAGK
jgi:hypothetical protein